MDRILIERLTENRVRITEGYIKNAFSGAAYARGFIHALYYSDVLNEEQRDNEIALIEKAYKERAFS